MVNTEERTLSTLPCVGVVELTEYSHQGYADLLNLLL